MNYFELFNIPIGFEMDKATLTKQFYVLSKLYHPDRFTLKSEVEKEIAEKKSAEINKAYKILKDKNTRLKYILDLLGDDSEEAKETLPQDFLMEMMDINEAIMDYKMDSTAAAKIEIEKTVDQFQTALNKDVEENMISLNFSSPDPTQVMAIKTFYLKSKYLKRITDLLEDKSVEV